MRLLWLVCALVVVSGCTPEAPDSPVATTSPAFEVQDVSVAVSDVDALAGEVLRRYVDTSNAIIARHGANADDIDAVTTPAWALEEHASFAALAALPETDEPPLIELGRWAVANVRGRTVLVDATVHACLSVAGQPTLVTVGLRPSVGSLVIDDLQPWEDATWCLAGTAS